MRRRTVIRSYASKVRSLPVGGGLTGAGPRGTRMLGDRPGPTGSRELEHSTGQRAATPVLDGALYLPSQRVPVGDRYLGWGRLPTVDLATSIERGLYAQRTRPEEWLIFPHLIGDLSAQSHLVNFADIGPRQRIHPFEPFRPLELGNAECVEMAVHVRQR